MREKSKIKNFMERGVVFIYKKGFEKSLHTRTSLTQKKKKEKQL
jgi:hypothetical protein